MCRSHKPCEVEAQLSPLTDVLWCVTVALKHKQSTTLLPSYRPINKLLVVIGRSLHAIYCLNTIHYFIL